jgi:hypothetical protein
MKTKNYNIDLMMHYQTNKELIFNEAIYKLDFLINKSAKAFVSSLPVNVPEGSLYILVKENDEKAYVACFINNLWHIANLCPGAIYYVEEEGAFFLLSNENKWQKAILPAPLKQPSNLNSEGFIGIKGDYYLPLNQAFLYLYLEENVTIKATDSHMQTITLFIKQNAEEKYQITWSENIIWPESRPFQILEYESAMNIIRLHKISSGEQFLAEIVEGVYYN